MGDSNFRPSSGVADIPLSGSDFQNFGQDYQPMQTDPLGLNGLQQGFNPQQGQDSAFGGMWGDLSAKDKWGVGSGLMNTAFGALSYFDKRKIDKQNMAVSKDKQNIMNEDAARYKKFNSGMSGMKFGG